MGSLGGRLLRLRGNPALHAGDLCCRVSTLDHNYYVYHCRRRRERGVWTSLFCYPKWRTSAAAGWGHLDCGGKKTTMAEIFIGGLNSTFFIFKSSFDFGSNIFVLCFLWKNTSTILSIGDVTNETMNKIDRAPEGWTVRFGSDYDYLVRDSIYEPSIGLLYIRYYTRP